MVCDPKRWPLVTDYQLKVAGMDSGFQIKMHGWPFVWASKKCRLHNKGIAIQTGGRT